jgi:hydroxyethylthiazole kinase-like uncharacterized protein yjeF
MVGGAPQMPGSATLAAIAALRAGAGKLQIAMCASIAPHVAAAIPEALVASLNETPFGGIALSAAQTIVERANAADALVFGPGLLDESACTQLLRAVAPQLRKPAVVDAGGLAALRDEPGLLHGMDGNVVLTPHAGELANLLSVERERIERDPEKYVEESAQRFRAVVALKGADTFIATPGGERYCNRHGSVGLATSGSGDTLAGIIGGILARGATPAQAAVWGVYLHAKAGETLTKKIGVGFLARELLDEIPRLMKSLA